MWGAWPLRRVRFLLCLALVWFTLSALRGVDLKNKVPHIIAQTRLVWNKKKLRDSILTSVTHMKRRSSQSNANCKFGLPNATAQRSQFFKYQVEETAPVAHTRSPVLSPRSSLPEKTWDFVRFHPHQHHLRRSNHSNTHCGPGSPNAMAQRGTVSTSFGARVVPIVTAARR